MTEKDFNAAGVTLNSLIKDYETYEVNISVTL